MNLNLDATQHIAVNEYQNWACSKVPQLDLGSIMYWKNVWIWTELNQNRLNYNIKLNTRKNDELIKTEKLLFWLKVGTPGSVYFMFN